MNGILLDHVCILATTRLSSLARDFIASHPRSYHFHSAMARQGRNGRKAQREKVSKNGNGFRDLAPLFKTPTQIVHHHVRRWEYGSLGRAVNDQGYAFSFAISDLPNSTEFTNLYDHYKLGMVEMIFELVTSSFTASPVESNALPTILITPDYDNATAPGSISVIQQYGQCERFTFSASKPTFSRRIVPRFPTAVVATTGGVIVGAGVATPGFLDCSYSSVPHYGLKFWISNYNVNTVGDTGIVINVSFRYHIDMRNTR